MTDLAAPPVENVRFGGIQRLYGDTSSAKLAGAHVCVLGVGGVGSWVVEALARTGIGRLTLVDLDEVCASNINRQLHALTDTIGRSKIDVLKERARAINPDIEVDLIHDFFTAVTAEAILSRNYDVVVDCIDQFKNKVLLLDLCRRRKQRVVVVGGAGGRKDANRVRVADIAKSEGDVMLAMIRKRLRQKHGFPRKGNWGIKCVYSSESPTLPDACDAATKGLDCNTGYGAAVFVTGTFGFMAASATVEAVLAAR